MGRPNTLGAVMPTVRANPVAAARGSSRTWGREIVDTGRAGGLNEGPSHTACTRMTLAPQIEGAVAIHSPAVQFAQAFRQRVMAGLLTGRPHARSNYRVVEGVPGQLRIRAMDWWTATNVGLNELELRFPKPGSVQYRVRYWRWASFTLGLSGILGLVGVLLLARPRRSRLHRASRGDDAARALDRSESVRRLGHGDLLGIPRALAAHRAAQASSASAGRAPH